MGPFYHLGIVLYSRIIALVGWFNPKAKAWWTGRKDKAFLNDDFSKSKVIWFHCASLGEFDQGLPLMRSWKERFPDYKIVVSFFSPSGIQFYNKRQHPVDHAFYLPIDTQRNASEFLSHIKPEIGVFMKYEFWGNHLFVARNLGIKLYSASAIFRDNQIYFKPFGRNQRRVLKCLDHFFVQNEKSKTLLESIDIRNVTVSGDLRYETVLQNKAKHTSDEKLSAFCEGNKAIVFGSTWPEDETLVFDLINNENFTDKVIIAPHDIKEEHLAFIEKNINKTTCRYSDFNKGGAAQIMIVDTIGLLNSAYQFGKFAYVGGGQSGALHNILEPAAYGLPVIIGPKHEKFPEANLFLEKGFALEISSKSEAKEVFYKMDGIAQQQSQEILRFMESKKDISGPIVDHMSKDITPQ